ncbi:peptidylprolyl isomerase SurA [Vibrio sp. S4M6]|uniref:peptidylprolyl isomerase SurA n=1 Tax=Vibrio sinus TaxID=2946865 RepID=UPI00202A30EE|nr:peptidylprolyl isomerase SurA [Vibrio sinus]MCL9780560.1 peptidylprolyl isomerase SurA [Vibrio sinus]
MKKWTIILSCLLAPFTMSVANAQPVELNKVVVIVNKGVILQSDVDTAMKMLKLNAKESDQTLPSDKLLKKQVIDKLILDKIQQQEAKRLGIQINDKQLDAAMEDIAKSKKLTLKQLITTVQNAGISYPTFRNEIRHEIAEREARNALVRQRINILPAEVNNLAKILANQTNANVEYKFAHIQLNFTEQDKQQVESQAEELVKKLKSGANFSTMAYSYSKGPKALSGGQWGWMSKEEMPTVFADQIKMQKKGSIIGPFLVGSSYHILKIEDVKGLKTIAVTEVDARHILIKPSIILSDAGAQKELNGFIKEIKQGKATFAELAKQYSQDPGSAAQGGNLGYQTPDSFVPEFKHQVETLPVGKISKPFKTVNGWHIVEVLGRKKVDRTDAAMKNRAYQILFNRKFNEEAGAWLQEMRAGAYVDILKGNNSDDS